MDPELQSFYNDVLYCLVKYGGLTRELAGKIVADSKLFEFDSPNEREMLFHELPYYWAMQLLYGKEFPEWHEDPELWPPPQDYLDHLKREGERQA